MNTILFRACSSSSRLTAVSAAANSIRLLSPICSSSSPPSIAYKLINPIYSSSSSSGGVTNFHSSRRVDVKSSAVAPQAAAGFAAVATEVSDDEDTSSTSNNGLEVSKLEISQEIVSALAKKGITKLFPIQRVVLETAMQGRDMQRWHRERRNKNRRILTSFIGGTK